MQRVYRKKRRVCSGEMRLRRLWSETATDPILAPAPFPVLLSYGFPHAPQPPVYDVGSTEMAVSSPVAASPDRRGVAKRPHPTLLRDWISC